MKLNKVKNQELNRIKEIIAETLKAHGIKKASIFGSFVRGEQTKNSDVDILIEYNGSLLKLINIERELERKLIKKVDLVTYKGISPYLKKYILTEEVRIL